TALRALRIRIRNRELSSTADLPPVRSLESSLLERAIRRLAAALAAMPDERVDVAAFADVQAGMQAPAGAPPAESGNDGLAASNGGDSRGRGLAPSTRQAIQAAVASA